MDSVNHSVSTNPGQTAFALILGASDRARAKVNVVNAPFDATYGTDEPLPVAPARDEVFTTAAPAIAASRRGWAAWTHLKGSDDINLIKLKEVPTFIALKSACCGANFVI